ncbi:hypothetical protein G210_2014 [Candida maltosa Xu316]|uniref:Uncharacterized protein n=1 Tax=Candida maltosa (strain Xu316) TaxID=1245528 RepID=M3JYV2_CANMX|nr:hypothetical protein G210_2014 [Candida maltosa Xu316]
MFNYKYSLATTNSSNSSFNNNKYTYSDLDRRNSQQSSILSTSSTNTSSSSVSPTTPQDNNNNNNTMSSQTLPLTKSLSEPCIDLDKITEEFQNRQRKLSIASAKIYDSKNLINWCQFLQEQEETTLYMKELNQNSSFNLPISSEILLERYSLESDDDDGDNCNLESDEPKKTHLFRRLSKFKRRNSLIAKTRKQTRV